MATVCSVCGTHTGVTRQGNLCAACGSATERVRMGVARIVLRPTPDCAQRRLGHSGQRVHAVCWHGHRDFFRALFERCPEARVQTACAQYDATTFEARYRATGHRNIGSVMEPLPMAAACDCVDSGASV